MLNTLLVIALMTISPPSNSIPNFITPLDFGGGGPDTFGYTWLDSDTSAPGAPTYAWIPIYGVGTRVTGLADDNVVGPFPIGFDFPYYWYTVNSFYIGSNGYISFGDNFLAAPRFKPVPHQSSPNNVLAPLMTDLDFSVGNASCWFWTNVANDTLIIEYDSVRFWTRPNGTGNNTFQIILSRPDSTITFQYKEQTGSPSNGWADSSSAIGIENVTGIIGLRYLYNGAPSSNMPHASLAICFTPPESSIYQVHDVGIYEALSENSGGIFIYNGDALTPWVKVKNTGNQPEANFPVCGLINNSTGTTIYADTLQAGSMNPGQIDSMTFSPNWIPSSNGLFTFTAKTSLTGDVYPGNDQAIVEMRVVTYPTEMRYDSSAQRSYYWNGPGGYGNRFIPPRYPCQVTGMKIYASATTPTNIFIGVLDDNGSGGSPGDTLTSATLNVIQTAMWYTVNFTNPATITDGAFFIGAISAVDTNPRFGMDTLPPFSRQGWEYTTSWAPSRHATIHDVCIRALVQTVPGIEEGLMPIASTFSITVVPNPFHSKTVIRFANPLNKTINFNIYNSIGTRVKTLTTKAEQVVWDGRDTYGKRLADGIYFLKTEDRKEAVEKLIITR